LKRTNRELNSMGGRDELSSSFNFLAFQHGGDVWHFQCPDRSGGS
jgi:hypothetical protein